MKKMWAVLAALVLVGVMAGPAEAKASKSCLAALDAAEDIYAVRVVYGETVSAHVSEVNRVTQAAGRTGDPVAYTEGVTDSIATLSERTLKLLDAGKAASDRFFAASKQCRAGK